MIDTIRLWNWLIRQWIDSVGKLFNIGFRISNFLELCHSNPSLFNNEFIRLLPDLRRAEPPRAPIVSTQLLTDAGRQHIFTLRLRFRQISCPVYLRCPDPASPPPFRCASEKTATLCPELRAGNLPAFVLSCPREQKKAAAGAVLHSTAPAAEPRKRRGHTDDPGYLQR